MDLREVLPGDRSHPEDHRRDREDRRNGHWVAHSRGDRGGLHIHLVHIRLESHREVRIPEEEALGDHNSRPGILCHPYRGDLLESDCESGSSCDFGSDGAEGESRSGSGPEEEEEESETRCENGDRDRVFVVRGSPDADEGSDCESVTDGAEVVRRLLGDGPAVRHLRRHSSLFQ